MQDDSLRDILDSKSKDKHDDYIISDYPVDNISLEGLIAQGRNFKSERFGIDHNFTVDVDPGYKYIEKFRSGFQW